MRIFKKINHVYLPDSNHLMLLSNERPVNGEWAFDCRPDEHGKLHPCVYIKQVDLHLMDTSTERAILASNNLPKNCGLAKKVSLPNIPDYQVKMVARSYADIHPCDIMVEYEEYAVGSFGMSDGEPTVDERIKLDRVEGDDYCNIREVSWNKSELDWELNHILNVAVCQGQLKNADSNSVAEFVNNWLRKKYGI